MLSICIYADGEYMRMPYLCRCMAYRYVTHMLASLISCEDPKKGGSGSSLRPRRAAAPAVHILWSPSLSCRGDTPYVVFYPVPDDRVLHTGKRRFAYFPAVVHFRKVGVRQKVGSAGNGSPVIYQRGYMTTYYQPENDDGMGKSSG